MKKNKFTSYVFSCLGVAACVSLYSCGGNKENDKFQSEAEFLEFLKNKAREENVTLDDNKLKDFVDKNWKTASKKTFEFTNNIKNEITEQTNPGQSNTNPNSGKQNTSQTSSEEQNLSQSNTNTN